MARRFAAAVALFYLPLALAAILWIAWRAGAEGLLQRLVGEQPLLALAIGAAVGVACAYGLQGLSALWSAARSLERALADLVGPLTPVACAVLALISGCAEEIVFRAALQPELGLLATSLLFGLVHAPLKRELLAWPLLAAAMGLVLGLLYEYTGAVLAPAAAHVAVNWINLLLLARRAREIPPPRLPGSVLD